MGDSDSDSDSRRIREIHDYTVRASSGVMGKLTGTPQATAVTVMVLMMIFILLGALLATQNDELLLQLLSLFPGANKGD